MVSGVTPRKGFDQIQIDPIGEIQKWANTNKNLQESVCIKRAIIAANNNYPGFGPDTANIFRNILRLSDAK